MANYLQQEWLAKLTVPSVNSIEVGGAPAAVTRLTLDRNGTTIYLTAAAIDFGGGRVARFVYQSTVSDSSLQGRFTQSFQSFRSIDDAEAAAIKPARIEIEAVTSGEDLSSILSGMAYVSKDKKALFILLNPSFEDGMPPAGQEYKNIKFGS